MAHPPLEIEKLPRSSPSPMTSTPAFFWNIQFFGTSCMSQIHYFNRQTLSTPDNWTKKKNTNKYFLTI